MKKLALLMALSTALLACDKLKKAEEAADKVPELAAKTGEMGAKMDQTNDAIRLQKMQIAMDGMLSEKSLERLYPVPTGLMPFAKVFADAAHADELVELTYAWLKEIDEVMPLKHVDPASGQEIEYTKNEKAEILKQKFGRFQALSAIAGFIPDHTLDEMIESEVLGAGRYRETVMNILMLRAVFIRQVLLEESILKTGRFPSVGAAEKAIEYMSQVDRILRLPFRADIMIVTRGLEGPEGYNGSIANADLKMDADMMQFMTSGWGRIADITENGLSVVLRNDSEKPAINRQNYERDLRRRDRALEIAKQKANAWKK
jgi:hypothetical protein